MICFGVVPASRHESPSPELPPNSRLAAGVELTVGGPAPLPGLITSRVLLRLGFLAESEHWFGRECQLDGKPKWSDQTFCLCLISCEGRVSIHSGLRHAHCFVLPLS